MNDTPFCDAFDGYLVALVRDQRGECDLPHRVYIVDRAGQVAAWVDGFGGNTESMIRQLQRQVSDGHTTRPADAGRDSDGDSVGGYRRRVY